MKGKRRMSEHQNAKNDGVAEMTERLATSDKRQEAVPVEQPTPAAEPVETAEPAEEAVPTALPSPRKDDGGMIVHGGVTCPYCRSKARCYGKRATGETFVQRYYRCVGPRRHDFIVNGTDVVIGKRL